MSQYTSELCPACKARAAAERRLEKQRLEVFHCHGPNCSETMQGWPWAWPYVSLYTEHGKHFCSLRCMANWLAGKLAEEETKARSV